MHNLYVIDIVYCILAIKWARKKKILLRKSLERENTFIYSTILQKKMYIEVDLHSSKSCFSRFDYVIEFFLKVMNRLEF